MRRFATHASEAMLIPDESVVNDQTRQIAYVVGNDGIVAQRTIEVGRLIDDMRVVRAGLAPTDRVIISGVQRARPGRKVNAQPGQMSVPFPASREARTPGWKCRRRRALGTMSPMGASGTATFPACT
jgi:hypothetical protein